MTCPRFARVHRMARPLVAVVAAATLLAGCGVARNELGTVNSNCYVVLPIADGAVHHHGKLHGVRLVSVASLRARAPHLYEAAKSAPPPVVREVCLVAFTGKFTSSAVTDPLGKKRGVLAVVEISYPQKRLLGTLLVRKAPLTFLHTHI